LILTGVVIGVIAATMLRPAMAQKASEKPRIHEVRLEVLEGGPATNGQAFSFIRDSKSNGCWMAAIQNGKGVTSLATAPATACQ
jgi:type II secretory pathway component PulJ